MKNEAKKILFVIVAKEVSIYDLLNCSLDEYNEYVLVRDGNRKNCLSEEEHDLIIEAVNWRQ